MSAELSVKRGMDAQTGNRRNRWPLDLGWRETCPSQQAIWVKSIFKSPSNTHHFSRVHSKVQVPNCNPLFILELIWVHSWLLLCIKTVGRLQCGDALFTYQPRSRHRSRTWIASLHRCRHRSKVVINKRVRFSTNWTLFTFLYLLYRLDSNCQGRCQNWKPFFVVVFMFKNGIAWDRNER